MHRVRVMWLCVLVASAAIAAQVPVTEEPRHRVTFANTELRILDVNIPPGDTSLEHRHDFDIVTVSMNDGPQTRTQSDDQPWSVRPARPLGNVSIAEYTATPASHRVQNVGQVAYRLFTVENLKPGSWSPAPALSAPATTLSIESRAFRVYDVQLGRDTPQTTHTHLVPTLLVLITGTALSDGPDARAKALAPAPVGVQHTADLGHDNIQKTLEIDVGRQVTGQAVDDRLAGLVHAYLAFERKRGRWIQFKLHKRKTNQLGLRM